MILKVTCLQVVFTLCIFLVNTLAIGPEVTTNYGSVKGRFNLAPNGKMVKEFLGVPFAKPPLGKLRFKAPVPPEKWDGVFDATELPNTCVQTFVFSILSGFNAFRFQTNMSEDCLYANIWVPNCPDCERSNEKLPVMMFFAGGGFFFGGISAAGYDGGVLATEGNVIVVTSNYRLATMGFFSLDDKEAPGNAGLLDQQMAMKWIHENIIHFGGDPDRITIYGQSAGSASVNFHLIAPSSWSYFQNAILQSGFVNDYWALASKKVNDYAGWKLAESLNCKKSTAKETLECLEAIDGETIQFYQPVINPGSPAFLPVIDGIFLKEHPLVSYRRGQVKPCNILAGVLQDEGSVFLPLMVPNYVSFFDTNPKPPYEAITSLLEIDPTLRQHKILFKSAEFIYTGLRETEDVETNLSILNDMLSDMLFTCRMKQLFETYHNLVERNESKIYSYEISYKLSYFPASWQGVHHAADLPLLFGHALNTNRNIFHNGKVQEDDVKFTKRVLRYWANFAGTGNPNMSTRNETEMIYWPEHTRTNEEYLILAPNTTTIGLNYRQKECDFQNKLMPILLANLNLTEISYSESFLNKD